MKDTTRKDTYIIAVLLLSLLILLLSLVLVYCPLMPIANALSNQNQDNRILNIPDIDDDYDDDSIIVSMDNVVGGIV